MGDVLYPSEFREKNTGQKLSKFGQVLQGICIPTNNVQVPFCTLRSLEIENEDPFFKGSQRKNFNLNSDQLFQKIVDVVNYFQNWKEGKDHNGLLHELKYFSHFEIRHQPAHYTAIADHERKALNEFLTSNNAKAFNKKNTKTII